MGLKEEQDLFLFIFWGRKTADGADYSGRLKPRIARV
jgi:hypothetical protein